jgi:hypothetical protein
MHANSPEEVDHLFVKYMREGDIESVLTLYDPKVAFSNQFRRYQERSIGNS